MLWMLLYVTRNLCRRLDRIVELLWILDGAFREALRLSAAARRKHPYIE
jgi:hypothetical protein